MQKVDKQKNEPNKLIIFDLVQPILQIVVLLILVAFMFFFAFRVGTAVQHSVRTESDKLVDFYEAYDSCMQESVNKDVCTLKAIEAYN